MDKCVKNQTASSFRRGRYALNEKRKESFMEIGYFCDKNREYVIENMRPVRPLKNYLWNDTTFAELNQFCFGTTKSCSLKI